MGLFKREGGQSRVARQADDSIDASLHGEAHGRHARLQRGGVRQLGLQCRELEPGPGRRVLSQKIMQETV